MAVGGEIASAYVRIRPQLGGFAEQATVGVKEGLARVQASVREAARTGVSAANQTAEANRRAANSYNEWAKGADTATAATTRLRDTAMSLGKVVGVAFGVDIAAQFAKGIVEHAASVQKQIEVVRAEFGKASDSVLEFSEKGGAALGISAHSAETAAARMGILFHNIGVGKQTAATATVDLLKLAGSISAIRGIDPAIALNNLPLAIAGNIRSLKQLGISTDAAQIKVAAFKLGLTQTVTQGLTRAQTALAITAIATAKLGDYQQQAAAHSGDLANRMRVLSAEWDNAKDSLGVGLLPPMVKVTNYLADKLPGAVEATKSAFKSMTQGINNFRKAISSITDILEKLNGVLGGVKGSVEALLAAFAVAKIVAFANAIQTQLIAKAMEGFVFETEAAKVAYIEAFGEMSIATVGLGVTIKSALITTGIGAIAVAIGIAAELIINHWDTVKRYTIATANGIKATWEGLKTVLIGLAEVIGGTMATSLTLPFKALLEAASAVSGFLGHFGIHIGGGAKEALAALDAVTTGLVTKGVENLTKGGKEMASALVNGFKASLDSDKNVFASALGDLFAGVRAAAAALAKTDPTTGAAGGTPAGSAVSAVDTAAQQAIQQARSKLSELKTQLHQLIAQNKTDIQNAVASAKSNLIQIGSTLADQIGSVIDQPFTIAATRLQTQQDQLALVFDTQNARLQSQANKLNQLQARLGLQSDKRNLQQLRNEVALPGGRRLSTDPKQALAELQNLAKGANQLNRPAIDQFIQQYQSALLQVSQDKLGLKQSGLDARRTAGETRLSLKQEQLAVAQDAAAAMKVRAQRDIADLTANLTKGAITLRTFNKRLATLLASDHVSYKKAGALLGSAFALGFRASVQGIAKQAAALAAGPQIPGTGLEPKITRPEVVVQKDQLKVLRLQHEIARQALTVAKKTKTAAEKQTALLEKIHATQLGPTSSSLGKNPGAGSKKARDLSGT